MQSYLSQKTQVRESKTQGKGLFAIKSIKKDEIIGIKSGRIFDEATRKKIFHEIGDSFFQIADNFFIGPLKKEEVSISMMHINHSCNPNIGVQGDIVFIAMREIKAGEELTLDYAMCDDWKYKMECNCKSKDCRKIITGKDWEIKKLQKKYRGYFSAYLQKKIDANIK